MPENKALGGLGDFDLPAPSQSNSTAQGGDPLADLLGNQVMDELGKSRQITSQMDALRGTPDKSLLERLLSSQGILPLLLAGGAAAAGQPGVAAGIGIGGLQGIMQADDAERSQRNKAMEDLNKQLDKSLDRQDKSRNRFIQLLQSQPDMFLDEQGNPTMDARVIGWYATGAPIELHPETKRILDQRDESWERAGEMFYKALQEAKDPESARVLTKNLFTHMGMADVPADVVEATVSSFGTPDFDRNFADTLLEFGGMSGRDAIIYAGENNLPVHHPEVLKMVNFQGKDATTPSQQINLKFLKLMDEVNRWQQDPRNTDAVLQIQAEAGSDIAGATREITSRALEGRNADISFFMDEANVPKDITTAMMLRQYSQVASKDKVVDAVRGAKDLGRKKELSDEEIIIERGAVTMRTLEENIANVQKAQGNRDAGLRNSTAQMLSKEFPSATLNQVYDTVDWIMDKALENATRDEKTGAVNRASFEAQIKIYTSKAIKDSE